MMPDGKHRYLMHYIDFCILQHFNFGFNSYLPFSHLDHETKVANDEIPLSKVHYFIQPSFMPLRSARH